MKEVKQAVKDATLTTQGAWKIIARRRKLTPRLRRELISLLSGSRAWIDDALALLDAEPHDGGGC